MIRRPVPAAAGGQVRALSAARVRALTLLAGAIQLVPLAAAAQVNIIGPCRDGHRWVATAIGQGPVATYSECRPVQPFVTVTCGGGGLWMRLDRPFPTLAPGYRRNEVLLVDETPIPVLLATGMSEVAGFRFVEFRLDPAAIQALSAGFRARLEVGVEAAEFHLAGSSEALGILARHC